MSSPGRPASRPPFSILVCQDYGLLREHYENLLASFPPPTGSWQRHVFWGDEEQDQKFWDMLSQIGLFGDSRVLLLRNAQEWNAESWRRLSAALAATPDFTWPIICLEVDWEKGKYKIPAHVSKTRCMTYATGKGWVATIPPLAGAALQSYVKKKAARLGLTFQGNALSIFCSTINPDAISIDNTLQKLALSSPDGQIDHNCIGEDYSSPESDAFACIKKLQRGDLAGAWRDIGSANASELLFFLIALLAREFRTLWQLNTGQNPWLHPSDAAFKRDLAMKIGLKGVSAGFCALADAEWQVKSGRQSPEQALEALAVTVAGIFCNGSGQRTREH